MDNIVYEEFVDEIQDEGFREDFVDRLTAQIEKLKTDYKRQKIARLRATIRSERKTQERSQALLDGFEDVTSDLIERKKRLVSKLSVLAARDTIDTIFRRNVDPLRRKNFGPLPRAAEDLVRERILEAQPDPMRLNLTSPHLVSLHNFSQLGLGDDVRDADSIVGRFFSSHVRTKLRASRQSRRRSRRGLVGHAKRLLREAHVNSRQRLINRFSTRLVRHEREIRRGRDLLNDFPNDILERISCTPPRVYETDIGISEQKMEDVRCRLVDVESKRRECLTQCESTLQRMLEVRDSLQKRHLFLSRENNKVLRRARASEDHMRDVKTLLRRRSCVGILKKRLGEEEKKMVRVEVGIRKLRPFSEKLQLEKDAKWKLSESVELDLVELKEIVESTQKQIDEVGVEIAEANRKIQQAESAKKKLQMQLLQAKEGETDAERASAQDADSKSRELLVLAELNRLMAHTLHLEEETVGDSLADHKLNSLLRYLESQLDDVQKTQKQYVENIAFLESLKQSMNQTDLEVLEEKDDDDDDDDDEPFLPSVHVREKEMANADLRRRLDEVCGQHLPRVTEEMRGRRRHDLLLERLGTLLWSRERIQQCFQVQGYDDKDFHFTNLEKEDLEGAVEESRSEILEILEENPQDEVSAAMKRMKRHSPTFFLLRAAFAKRGTEMFSPESSPPQMELFSPGEFRMRRMPEERRDEIRNVQEQMDAITKSIEGSLSREQAKMTLRLSRLRESQRLEEYRRQRLKKIKKMNQQEPDPVIVSNALNTEAIADLILRQEEAINSFSPREMLVLQNDM